MNYIGRILPGSHTACAPENHLITQILPRGAENSEFSQKPVDPLGKIWRCARFTTNFEIYLLSVLELLGSGVSGYARLIKKLRARCLKTGVVLCILHEK
jgi:hypothetical protein